jgi:uncharacterized protein YyaL (SSP411 family)
LEAAAFEPAPVLELLEERFVTMAVDRDERRDLAEAYAEAFLLLPDPHPAPDPGLPFVVVTTADGHPLEGTSLWRDERPLGPSLLSFLQRLASEWDKDRPAAEARAGLVLAALRDAQAVSGPAPAVLDVALVERALGGLAEAFDPKRGGFGAAPKRPPHGALRLLLEEEARTGNRRALTMATATLDAIAKGGLRDAAGGFFREASADDWTLPVREKTLADNALLLDAFVRAYEATGSPSYRDAATSIAHWALMTMRDSSGAFQAAVAGTDEHDARVFAYANGLMIGALARSGQSLSRKEDTAAATAAAQRITERLFPPVSLRRFAEGDEARGGALLEDHAYLAQGLLDLQEATLQERWTVAARSLVDAALLRFSEPSGGGFFTSAEDGALRPARLRDGYDGRLLSANAVMASVLLRLARVTGEMRYHDWARRTVLAFATDLSRAPRGMETMAAVAGELLGRPQPDAERGALLGSRAVRGPVAIAASLRPARLGPGQAGEAHIELRVQPGFAVTAHRPTAFGPSRRAGKDLAGLIVAVPGGPVSLRPPQYAEGAPLGGGGDADSILVYTGETRVVIPFRSPPGTPPGELRIRFRVVFQICRADRCEPPDRVLLEVPLIITSDPS